jgi:hypothetical protein
VSEDDAVCVAHHFTGFIKERIVGERTLRDSDEMVVEFGFIFERPERDVASDSMIFALPAIET